MATFVFDGTSNITASKADNVVITAPVTSFTGVADSGGNSVFNFGGRTLTITGTAFGANATAYPNVTVAGGVFSTAAVNVTANGNNDLVIGSTGTVTAIATANTSANTVHSIFGGLGVSDPIDGADTITLGGKGSNLVYGNAGNDTINQGGNVAGQGQAFDSTSFETIFAGKGDDTITLTGGTATTVGGVTTAATNNVGAKMAIYGGEGTDTINIQNGGQGANTAIFGGQGAADSTDAADTITFNGGGTVNIFGNAGADTITLGGTQGAGGVAGTITANANVTVHGGIDGDTININVGTTTTATAGGVTTGTTVAANATIVAYGDEGADTITVNNNAGTTVIYGDTAAADSAGGADTITYSGQGTATIYAAGGNDTVTLNGAGTATADSTSTTTVFGGNGNDVVVIGNHNDGIGTFNITLGAGADAVRATTTGAAGTVVGQNINITDFVIGAGNDSITLTTGNAQASAVAVGGTFQTLQQALDAAANAVGSGNTAGGVGIVAFSGSSYVVVNENGAAGGAGAGFQAGADLAIKLTGVTDALSASASITSA